MDIWSLIPMVFVVVSTRIRKSLVAVETMSRVWDCCEKYTGPECEQPVCFGNTTCLNGGTCLSPDSCACLTGFTGGNCEEAICFGKTSCANGGSCLAPDVCSCAKGYTGINCETEDECAECDHICDRSKSSVTCSCKENYKLQADGKSCKKISRGNQKIPHLSVTVMAFFLGLAIVKYLA